MDNMAFNSGEIGSMQSAIESYITEVESGLNAIRGFEIGPDSGFYGAAQCSTVNQYISETCTQINSIVRYFDEFKEKLIMFMALHELRHAEQNKMLNETFKNYDKTQIKYLLISLFKSTSFIKMMYHDKLYYEFDANMDASMYFKDDEVMKRYLAYKFLVSYTNKPGKEIIEPINNNMTTFGNSLNGFTHFEVGKYLNGHNDEITDSMQLGFTVKKEEINKIIKLYRG